jgi:hypothetical protein
VPVPNSLAAVHILDDLLQYACIMVVMNREFEHDEIESVLLIGILGPAALLANTPPAH